MLVDGLDQLGNQFSFYDLRSQLTRFVYERSEEAFARGEAERDAIKTKAQLQARKAHIRQAFLKGIGGLPSMDTPLNPQTVGRVECDGFAIKKIVYESRPKAYVTANLYLPNGLAGKTGAVLFVCGHHLRAKHEPEYQVVCQHMVQAGLVVLAVDPMGQGERLSYCSEAIGQSDIAWGTFEHDYAGAQCLPLGHALARYFLHDAMRGIDYLCTRPEVDATKIGATGNSGGGLQTAMLMMCEDRLAAAAPGTFIMARRDNMYTGSAQDAEQIWPGFTAAGCDHEDILLAFAPKPLLVLAVKYDFFPIEGTRKTVGRAARFWQLEGDDGTVELFEDSCPHQYNPRMATRAAQFFSTHLLGEKRTPNSADVVPVEPEKLWCTQSGQTGFDFPGARFTHAENKTALENLVPAAGLLPAWAREAVFRHRLQCPLNIRHIHYNGAIFTLSSRISLWWAQQGLFNVAYAFRSTQHMGQKLPVTLAVWENGTADASRHWQWIVETCARGREVVVLDVSGVGACSPHSVTPLPHKDFYGTIHKIAEDLFWLNDSLPAMRAYDITRAVDALHDDWPDVDTGDIRLYTHGRASVYGQLAALVDARIGGVDTQEPFEGFAAFVGAKYYNPLDIYSFVLPGILQAGDLPAPKAAGDKE